MSTSNKNFLSKRTRSRDIVNSLITSNTNYKYRLTRQRYNTLTLLDSLTLFVWQPLMHNLTPFHLTHLVTSQIAECHVTHRNLRSLKLVKQTLG